MLARCLLHGVPALWLPNELSHPLVPLPEFRRLRHDLLVRSRAIDGLEAAIDAHVAKVRRVTARKWLPTDALVKPVGDGCAQCGPFIVDGILLLDLTLRLHTDKRSRMVSLSQRSFTTMTGTQQTGRAPLTSHIASDPTT